MWADSLDHRKIAADHIYMARVGGTVRRRHRVATLAALSLLLGLVTTWLVAWGFSLRILPDLGFRLEGREYDHDGWTGNSMRFHGLGSEFTSITVSYSDDQPVTAPFPFDPGLASGWTMANSSWRNGQLAPLGARQSSNQVFWHTFPNPTMPTTETRYDWWERRVGLPMGCLCWWGNGASAGPGFHSLNPPGWLRALGGNAPTAALPVRVHWPGLLLDTVFFAALWPATFVCAASARRRVRRRHGRCPMCNYDLCGEFDAGCPECGWGRSDVVAKGADGGDG